MPPLLRSLLAILLAPGWLWAAERLEFNRDVRPILSNKCFRCHGPDEHSRQAELRLDDRASAIAQRDGKPAVVPRHPDDSALIRRIHSSASDKRMPPPDSKLELGPQEKETLRRWIAEGAAYQPHWSLIPPRAADLPDVAHTAWLRNEVDPFVLARLEGAGLAPSEEASRESLLRRVSLDLTGLPPTLEQLDAFLTDTEAGAYERAVDRLLASPRFGERMAVDWLDAARYADTNGYFGDHPRSVWPWRDWVIAAYNQNLPFDQFTIRQLAGDLLPDATLSDKIATGFNRNHMANNETGIIDEEYRVEYVADQVETTAATWLGLTVGCARCHDHKYDPVSQREFYQLFAFFNNSPETGLITSPNPPPTIEIPSPEQQAQLEQLAAANREAEREYAPIGEALQARIAAWEPTAASDLPPSPRERLVAHLSFDDDIAATSIGTTVKFERGVLGKAALFDATQHVELDSQVDLDAAWSISVWSQATSSLGCLLSKIEPEGDRRGLEILWQKGRFQINLVHRWGASVTSVATRDPVAATAWHQLVLRYDGSRKADGLTVFVDGRPAAFNVQLDTLDGSLRNEAPVRVARRDSGLGFYGRLDELRILQRAVTDEEVEKWYWSERLRGILAVPRDQRSAADQEVLLDYYVEHHSDAAVRDVRRRRGEARQAEANLRASIPTSLVMQELPQPRATAVLARGQYDRPGEIVQPETPATLSPWPADAPRNRLGLAQWLVSPAHPLTARVAVNRLWQQCFGEGIVRTVNDFGSQGEMPTHPELLDRLAVDFMADRWDVKASLRRIVTSAAYRQTSAASESLLERDAGNRWLARGPRFRLSAEMVRDQALAVSGLLVPRLGGPSVKPYQPPGLWEAVSYNGDETYVPDKGEGLWRRSLYTYVKRQAPPPALLTFDGPTREKCTVRRARTNTPLQALALLNDPTYIEAARGLAALTLAEPGDDAGRLREAFRRVASRSPDPQELQVLRALLEKQRVRFRTHRGEAERLLALGQPPGGRELDPAELASWTVTTHTLMNLDETITRR